LKFPAAAGGTSPGGVPLGAGALTSGVTPGIPIVQIPTPNGSGEAIWEWVAPPQLTLVQSLEFGIVLAMPAGAGVTPAAVTATVNLSLGPLSAVATASENDPVPRFVDTSKALSLFTLL